MYKVLDTLVLNIDRRHIVCIDIFQPDRIEIGVPLYIEERVSLKKKRFRRHLEHIHMGVQPVRRKVEKTPHVLLALGRTLFITVVLYNVYRQACNCIGYLIGSGINSGQAESPLAAV